MIILQETSIDHLGEIYQDVFGPPLFFHLNSASCIFWTHSSPIATRLYWSDQSESCGRLFVHPIKRRLCPTENSHWSRSLASGLFCRIFYQNIGNGHRHVPSNIRWLWAVKAVTFATFHWLEVTLEWGVWIWKGLTPQKLFGTEAFVGGKLGTCGAERESCSPTNRAGPRQTGAL